MSDQKKGSNPVPADVFLAKHESDLAESEQVISQKLLTSMFPQGLIPIGKMMPSDPQFAEWWKVRESLPGYRLISDLKQYWLVRLLRAATKENSPEAYQELLEGWLIQLGAEAPEGVFVRPRRRRGAPLKASTDQIFQIWVANGRPSWTELAYHVYGAEYTRADSQQRKKLRDRCVRAIRRREAATRRNSLN